MSPLWCHPTNLRQCPAEVKKDFVVGINLSNIKTSSFITGEQSTYPIRVIMHDGNLSIFVDLGGDCACRVGPIEPIIPCTAIIVTTATT
jgi:hypothetical protein